MAAPVLQGQAHTAFGSGTASFVGAMPASVAPGDLLVAVVAAQQSVASWTATGWTLRASRTAGGTPYQWVFTRTADGSEGATQTFTPTSTTAGAVTIHRITGADLSAPIDASAFAVTASGSSPTTLGSMTPTVAETLYLAEFVLNSASVQTITGPASMTKVYSPTATGYQGTGFTETGPASGVATGTRDFSSSSSVARSVVGVLIAPAGGAAGQTLSPTGIPSAEAFGTPTVTQGPAPAQTVSPTGISSAEAFGTPTVSATGPTTQTVSPTGIASAEAFGTPTIAGGTEPVILADGGTPLFVELTTLHYPDTPAKVLAVLQEFDGLEVAIPLGVQDVRSGKVTLSIYDEAVLKPVLDYLENHGEDELAYAVCLRVRYYGLPVLWGPITLPEWNGGPAVVTLNAVGPELRLQHQYLKDDDPTSSGPLAESGKYEMSTEGLRYLRDAGINEAADTTHNVPDLGIVDGSEAIIPAELDPVPRLTFKRHDEIWRAMQELSGHELAPDFEVAPTLDVPGAYARLNCYFPQGTDRTGAVRLYYGFGPDNLADFTSTPGGKIVTRATYVSSDDKVRKRATAWSSASFRGIYGSVEATDYDSTSDSVGEALTLRSKREVRKYRTPPKSLKVTLKPEAAIDDPLRRHRYGRDFVVGDIVYVNAKKGWMRYDGDARIVKVTLRQTDAGVVPDLDLVPDVGDGTPDTGDG